MPHVSPARQATRFWRKVNRCAHRHPCRTCCWEWQGCRSSLGYGRTRMPLGGRDETHVHRIAYILTTGMSILPGSRLEVCHACDNPPCCNPSHLWLGTHYDNHRDSTVKQRRARGRNHVPPKKLSVAKVRRIWRLWYRGCSQRKIAARMGVSQRMISQILMRKAWKHVEPPANPALTQPPPETD